MGRIFKTYFSGDKAFLSNMYPCTIVTQSGIKATCSESLFQAFKSYDAETRKKIAGMNGYMAKKEGKRVRLDVKEWEHRKIKVMFCVLRLKFLQNHDLAQKLLNTGNEILVEGNTWGDKEWGVDYDTRYGKNILGQLLMLIRAMLRNGTLGQCMTVNGKLVVKLNICDKNRYW